MAPIPHGHWKSTTFIGGLTSRGFVAPYVLDGPMNGAIFRAWIEQMLAPELRPGDIVIMDNLAAHKVDGIAQAITDRGAELRYLPPYSPDLNPIEQAFAKLKALLRKAAERTVDGSVECHRQAARPVSTSRVRQLSGQFRLSTVSVNML